MRSISLSFSLLADPFLTMDHWVFFLCEHQFDSKILISSFEEMIRHCGTLSLCRPVFDPHPEKFSIFSKNRSPCFSHTSPTDLFAIVELLFRFIRESEMSKIEVLN